MNITDLDQCSGCSLCVVSCPVQAIEQRYDKNAAFWYPQVDETKCVKCQKCVSVCPQNNTKLLHMNQGVCLVAQNTDLDSLKAATSGGAASAIAKAFVQRGGVVYGASFGSAMRLNHIRRATAEDCEKITGSKYVQSDVLGAYSQIGQDLKQNLLVLFIGTPCQCVAMQQVFDKYENFFCCDFICNGVGSPSVFAKHLQYLEKIYHCTIVSYIFRPKKSKYLEPYEMFYDVHGREYRMKSPWKKWGSMYYAGLVLRPSCYHCKFTETAARAGNITFSDIPLALQDSADFPYAVKQYGGSLIRVNDKKGEFLLDICPALYTKSVDATMRDHNKHAAQNPEKRNDFLRMANISLEKAKAKHLGYKTKIKGTLIELVDILRRKSS